MKTKKLITKSTAGQKQHVATPDVSYTTHGGGRFDLRAFDAAKKDIDDLEVSLASVLKGVDSQEALDSVVDRVAALTRESFLYVAPDSVTEILRKYGVSAKEVRMHGRKERRFPVKSYQENIVYSYVGSV